MKKVQLESVRNLLLSISVKIKFKSRNQMLFVEINKVNKSKIIGDLIFTGFVWDGLVNGMELW